MKKEISAKQQLDLLQILKARFEKNMQRHKGTEWSVVLTMLQSNTAKIWTLNEMEQTGGEPDVVILDKKNIGDIYFCDCAAESPSGRRSLCYDRTAWESRKENKPKSNAEQMATEMGLSLLTEDQYRALQKLGSFDLKTSSWIKTPEAIRQLGGALFCDRRYDTVFVYHNGAESYYAARGFRGIVKL